jgi:DNA-binding MarR family transcriptional regulator
VRDVADEHVAAWSGELHWMDPVQEAIIVRLAVLGRHLTQTRRSALAGGGLEHWQFKVLLALRRGGPPYEASPSQLADRLGLTRGALSARLRPMEESGLIARTGEDGDRRRVRVRLTDAGDEAFERHAGTENRGEAALLAALDPAERQTLAGLLRKLVLAADDNQPPESADDRGNGGRCPSNRRTTRRRRRGQGVRACGAQGARRRTGVSEGPIGRHPMTAGGLARGFLRRCGG